MNKNEQIEKIKEIFKGDKKRMAIAAVAVLGIILVVLSLFTDGSKKSEEASTAPVQQAFSEEEYTRNIEARLESMVSSVSGAGRTKVLVTLECDYETVYARNGTLSQDEGSSNEKSEYIIIGSTEDENGLLLKTVTPKVRGVAVVCEGGNNPQVESAVTQLLAAVLDVGTNHISVSKIK